MARSPHILVLGYNAWDVNLPVKTFPRQDAKCEVSDIQLGGGGPGATASVAMARLGAQVSLISQFGDDLPSRAQWAELQAANVDLRLSPVVAGHESPKAVILVHPEHGERTIFWSRGDLPPLDPAAMDPRWLEGVDLFYTDGHDAAAALVLAREAKRRGLPVVMDAGSVREGSADLVEQVTDVVSSEGFAPALSGHDHPAHALRALRRRGPERVAMTFGRRGVLALVDEAVVHVPAFNVEVVDTTGAGDAFHAGYAFARASGQEFLSSLRYGSAVAALKCGQRGGRLGLPSATQVAEMLQANVRHDVPDEFISYLA